MATLSAGEKSDLLAQLEVVKTWSSSGTYAPAVENIAELLGEGTLSAEDKQEIHDELLVLSTQLGGPRQEKVLAMAAQVLGVPAEDDDDDE